MLVTLLTLNKSKKVAYFANFGQFKKVLVILLTLNNTVRPPLVTYPSLCSTCMTYGTLCHAIGHQPLLTHPIMASAMDLRESFLLSGVFYFKLLPAFFSGFPGRDQFNLKVCRASCWSSKHSPGPTICLNHSNPQKFYTG